MNFDKELDARGLNCPLPILRAKKALNEMTSGQVLKIVATDPGSVKDFQAFSKQTGNELLSHAEAQKEQPPNHAAAGVCRPRHLPAGCVRRQPSACNPARGNRHRPVRGDGMASAPGVLRKPTRE